MSTQTVANRLVELCRQLQFEAAQKELYAQDAVSIEPHETPAFPRETKGLQAIIDKGHKWSQSVEKMHSCTVSSPVVAGNSFAVTMALDITMKGQGRMQMQEICVYQLKDDKIISEQFFM
jgi:hypothetical protein